MVGARSTGSQIDLLRGVKGSDFLMDGYITLGKPRNITIGGYGYNFQCCRGSMKMSTR